MDDIDLKNKTGIPIGEMYLIGTCKSQDCIRINTTHWIPLLEALQSASECSICGRIYETDDKVFRLNPRDILGLPEFQESCNELIGNDDHEVDKNPGLVYGGCYYILFASIDGVFQYDLIIENSEYTSKNLHELEIRLAEYVLCCA